MQTPRASALSKSARKYDQRAHLATKSCLYQNAEMAAAESERLRDRLVALTSHASESGFGVTVTRYWKQGSVDYKKVPELRGVDLERYRGKGREEVRVVVAR